MRADWWWDESWNPVAGCSHVSPGCTNCYAQERAGTLLLNTGGARAVVPLYENITKRVNGRPVFNGRLAALPAGHAAWTWPLRWKGAERPLLGPDAPSLLFVGDMSDLFHERRETALIDRVVGTVSASDHIGQLLTKRPERMADYFRPDAARYARRLWLGFSAERQREFDERWPPMRKLAEAGFVIFLSIAPMLGPIRLPADFLDLGERGWVICSGEQGTDARNMDLGWARALRDQCRQVSVPFFMKQRAGKAPIPPDLFIRELPRPRS